MSEQTTLTSARWELLNGDHDLSPETAEIALNLLNERIGYPPPRLGLTESDHGEAYDLTGTIALVVGHGRPVDQGTTAHDGTVEEVWNRALVQAVAKRIRALAPGLNVVRLLDYEGSSYGRAMSWVAGKLDAIPGLLFGVEFHFNAYNGSAEGFEYLYWHKSFKGKRLASIFQDRHAKKFPRQENRGVEPLGDQAHERGLLFCKLPKAPTIIAEPGFGDNPEDAEHFLHGAGRERLIEHYAQSCIAAAAEFDTAI
jgi:N-acetylmuramoyl-L-alanine amidase